MSWVDQKLENIVKKSPRHRSRAQEGPFEGVVPLTMLRALLVVGASGEPSAAQQTIASVQPVRRAVQRTRPRAPPRPDPIRAAGE